MQHPERTVRVRPSQPVCYAQSRPNGVATKDRQGTEHPRKKENKRKGRSITCRKKIDHRQKMQFLTTARFSWYVAHFNVTRFWLSLQAGKEKITHQARSQLSLVTIARLLASELSLSKPPVLASLCVSGWQSVHIIGILESISM
jgi:hypothetical protein